MIYDLRFKNNTNGGFIALISVILISVTLLLIATTLSITGFYDRFNILNSELKERSSALADACVDTALLGLASDPAYNPVNLVVPVGSDACTIINIVPAGSQKIINTKAHYQNLFTNLKVTVDATTFAVIAWEEVP